MKKKSFLKAVVMIAMICLASISCKKEDSPGANEVFIQNEAYSPATITVKKGTTVKWTNKDSEQHSVTADAAGFDSGTLNAGQSYSFTPGTAGTFTYHCNFHSTMHGTLIVTN